MSDAYEMNSVWVWCTGVAPAACSQGWVGYYGYCLGQGLDDRSQLSVVRLSDGERAGGTHIQEVLFYRM